MVLVLLSGLAACGGSGGGNTSTGGVYFTHEELAEEFVRRMSMDLGWSVQLVKANTQQYNYIVIKDGKDYDAFYIGKYNPGEDLKQYIKDYKYKFYYDLDKEGSYYVDPETGTQFRRVAMNSKNLSTAKAIRQEFIIADAALRAQAKYGLSEEKAMDTARFAYNLKVMPRGSYKMSDFDSFAKELTGSTIADFQKDFKEGNLASLTERIQKASETTGMGVEHTNQLIRDIFVR